MINYYSFNLTKKLTVIGPGHNPVDKQNLLNAFCDNVFFSAGSTGSTVIGLQASAMYDYSNNIDSITILNCKILDALYFQYGYANNWLIDGCVFTSSGHCLHAIGNLVGDMQIRNCVFNGDIHHFDGAYIGYNYVTNNIFIGTAGSSFTYCNYFYINNNIFYRQGMVNYANIGLSYNKNMSYNCNGGNSFPNGNNYENVDPMFVTNIGTGDYFSYATDYHLQTLSPAKNAGSDGTDLGLYGGAGDYDQNGVGHNPYIKTFNITGPTSINAGDPLQVYIKAKVRN